MVLVALVATGSRLPAQTKATVTNVATIPHEAVPNFFKNPPGIYTGENMGIATNSKGNIYIYHRAYETRLFEYSPQGEFIREIGRNNYGFSFAHSVRVDAQDNIWAVDEGTDMLVKFSPEGRILMTIGRREDPVEMLSNMPGAGRFHGRNEKYRFGRQTDVAFDQQGNIFVSDGYFDGRVVKYDKNGRFVKAVGTRGNQNLQFNTPHSIATDFQGNVYVGDRGNARVQVLDNDLNWKRELRRAWAIPGRCASRADPARRTPASSISTSRTRGRTARRPPAPSSPARSTKWTSTPAPSSASSDAPARHRVSSRRFIRSIAATPTHLHRRDQQLALAEDSAQAPGDEDQQPGREEEHHERMSRTIVASVAAAILAIGGSLVAQSGAPDISFTSADLLRTPVAGPFVGEVGGVGADSKGQIFVYTRTGHPYATLGDNRTFSRGGSKLYLFDAKGNFVREWGQDVYGFNAASACASIRRTTCGPSTRRPIRS